MNLLIRSESAFSRVHTFKPERYHLLGLGQGGTRPYRTLGKIFNQ